LWVSERMRNRVVMVGEVMLALMRYQVRER
jgi:hypothetical protein